MFSNGRLAASELLVLLVVVSLGCWTGSNLPMASVFLFRWTALRVANLAAASCDTLGVTRNSLQQTLKHTARWIVPTLCLTLTIAISWDVFPQLESRLGWGLNRRLDDRLLNLSLEHAHSSGVVSGETAHCTDVRAAGMLAWSGRPIKPYLVPQRALVNGRLRDEVLLNRELEIGWLKQHRRSDGTDGGWWLPLRTRRTALLLSSAERTTLIQNLRPTIWKPLSVDSAVIAYALAGDPRFVGRISEVRSQQELIDRGEWSFQPETPSGNDMLFDVVGWSTGMPDTSSILRQSAVLRAMNLPLAATRVMRPLLPPPDFDGRVRRDFVACQLDLARREYLTIGQVGEFRHRALKALGAESAVADFLPSAFPSSTFPPSATAGSSNVDEAIWSAAIASYLSGAPHEAARALGRNRPEAAAAAAMLEWEAGRLDEAREAWTGLIQSHPSSRYSTAASYALASGEY
jgi:hypothetical protein